ncbi:hypothetical protein Tco_0748806 [Tanacetum coccineum]|uniref:Reverse transcriptase Ty1/copia-type domain-containing protein n=1 Tax=Tanacetum coccineum TaxID=301880 RepID=A0ABQ4YXL7_9ASTR
METYNPISTPMEIKDKLDLDQNGTLVDATKYQSMIGALMYITSSRPDIVHATCLCARYQAKPTEKHLKEDSGFELTGFTDAYYAGCKDSFKSNSGGAQFLGKKLSRKIQAVFKAKDHDIKLKSQDIKIKIQDHKHVKGSSKEFPSIQGSKIQDVTRSEAISAMTTP